MLKTNVYDMSGKVVEEIELDANIFGIEVNEPVMHAAVKNQLANKRQGTHSTKGRSEVSGGGKNHTDRRVPVGQDRVAPERHNGSKVVLSLDLPREITAIRFPRR